MAEPTETLLVALTNFSCDDTTLVKLVKDTIRALDRDLDEGNYVCSPIADKVYDELEEYIDELNSYDDDEEEDDEADEDTLRDVDDD